MNVSKWINRNRKALEAVQELYEFFDADMWYTCNEEWESEEDMSKYLKSHFDICLKQIKELEDETNKQRIKERD